jgi:hypothetical protein
MHRARKGSKPPTPPQRTSHSTTKSLTRTTLPVRFKGSPVTDGRQGHAALRNLQRTWRPLKADTPNTTPQELPQCWQTGLPLPGRKVLPGTHPASPLTPLPALSLCLSLSLGEGVAADPSPGVVPSCPSSRVKCLLGFSFASSKGDSIVYLSDRFN